MDDKINVIKAIREIKQCALKPAIDLVNQYQNGDKSLQPLIDQAREMIKNQDSERINKAPSQIRNNLQSIDNTWREIVNNGFNDLTFDDYQELLYSLESIEGHINSIKSIIHSL